MEKKRQVSKESGRLWKEGRSVCFRLLSGSFSTERGFFRRVFRNSQCSLRERELCWLGEWGRGLLSF